GQDRRRHRSPGDPSPRRVPRRRQCDRLLSQARERLRDGSGGLLRWHMTSLKDIARALLPESMVAYARAERARRRRTRQRPAYSLSREEFRDILTDALHLETGDTVFVHSSVDRIGLQFPFFGILSLLREVVGENGTVLFPTYPRLAAHEALLSGDVFDVRRSPSFTGILTEFARRQPGAIRSLNPTKSVAAIGPLAAEPTD